MNDYEIVVGSSHPRFGQKVCKYISDKSGRKGKAKGLFTRYSDGEPRIEIDDNVRKKDVYVIQSTCSAGGKSVSENFVELCLILDALKRTTEYRKIAVIPYFGFARQDQKKRPRVPISAKWAADVITMSGATRIITMDLHAAQIQGFFNIPVDNLFASSVFIDTIREKFREAIREGNLVIVSPDAGGVERARAFAKRLNADLAIIDKRRDAPNVAEAMAVIGDVYGKVCLIIDDISDTFGSIDEAVLALIREKAVEVHALAAHAVLSGPAVDRIIASPIKTLTVTDSIPLGLAAKKCRKIKHISVDWLFGEAIMRNDHGDSVTSLFV